MPRLREPKKDVAACDKPRGGGKQPLIRGFPNGGTLPTEGRKLSTEYIGRKSIPAEVKHLSKRRKRK